MPSPSEATEERKLVAAARLNPRAFSPLYHRYVTGIYRYFACYAASQEDAQDLTALTFTKALEGLGHYEERERFTAWLFAIARHTLRDYQRRRRPAASVSSSVREMSDPVPSPEAQALLSEQSRALRKLIAQLPADQREAVVLRFFGQLSVSEVAAAMGRSEGAVRMLVYRALSTLRICYPQGEGP